MINMNALAPIAWLSDFVVCIIFPLEYSSILLWLILVWFLVAYYNKDKNNRPIVQKFHMYCISFDHLHICPDVRSILPCICDMFLDSSLVTIPWNLAHFTLVPLLIQNMSWRNLVNRNHCFDLQFLFHNFYTNLFSYLLSIPRCKF